MPTLASLAAHMPSCSTNPHDDPMFDKNPSNETRTTSHGDVVSFPYHAYDADGQLIHGYADLSRLRQMLRGSGLEPIEVGSGKGIVTLWLMSYNDTSIGPYQELVVTVAADKTARRLADHGPMTTMWPLLNGAPAFSYKLVLNSRLAVDYGRELMGLDKALGKVTFSRHGDRTKVEVAGATGARVLFADTSVDSGLLATLHSAGQLMASVGIFKTLKGLLVKEQAGALTTMDVARGGRVPITNPALFKGDYKFGLFGADDHLQFGDHPLGKALQQMGFSPQVVLAGEHMKFAYGRPR